MEKERNNTQKTRTPAQDRLLRLQKNLEKAKNKELCQKKISNISERLKTAVKNEYLKAKNLPESNKKPVTIKKNAVSDIKKPNITEPSIKNALPINQNISIVKRKEETEKDEVKNDTTKTSHDNAPKDENKNEQFRILKNLPEDDVCSGATTEKKAQKRKITEVIDFASLKKGYDIKSNCTSKNGPSTSNPKKSRTSNDDESADEKRSFLSNLKGYCTTWLKKVTSSSSNLEVKTPIEDLSLRSKNSSQRNQYISHITSSPVAINEARSKSCLSKGSANNRLQRLRKSLHDQQASLNETPVSSHSSLSSHSPSSFASVTLTKLKDNEEYESMDWQPIIEAGSEQACNTNISLLSSAGARNESTSSEHTDTINENLLRLKADKKQEKIQWKTNFFYFVVDTNVFLQNITFIDDLTSMKLCDTDGTIIYIPYIVLQELDKLKVKSPNESIKLRSVRAIRFLNKAFEAKLQNVQAQSSADESRHFIKVTSPDDSILNCCLQVQKHVSNILLLTEDINLRNKAKCSNILVSTKSDLTSISESAT